MIEKISDYNNNSKTLLIRKSDLPSVLGTSRKKAYDLCEIKGFPIIIIQGQTYIERKGLEKWINLNLGKAV